jgi:hypothetical protein
LPKTGEVHVHRAEIERRQDRVRALIDFTAFAPGARAACPRHRRGPAQGLEVRIASVLDGVSAELSLPEKALVAPGTYALIYGGIFLLAAAAVSLLLLAFARSPRVQGVP